MGGLGYTLSGDAGDPALLFLHGFMGSSEDWRDTIAALDGRYRCLAMDLPGHGASLGLPPENYTFEGATRALLNLLDELGIGRPAIVGYSMGGRLALYLALRHPERCAGLFVESASPGIEDAAERQARREADEERARRLEDDFESFLANWYRQPLFASLARREGLVEAMIEARARNDPGELTISLRGMGTGRGPTLWGELAGLRVPALVVAGEFDEKFVRVSHRMAGPSPNVRVAVVPDAGHNVRAEVPEAYLSLLETFLLQARW
jgi:2-succinyl-6-hydroxy-2,4-cyclohexadiene-1-carboxylate synthase